MSILVGQYIVNKTFCQHRRYQRQCGGCNGEQYREYQLPYLRYEVFAELGDDLFLACTVNAGRAGGRERSAAFGAYGKLLFVYRFHTFVGFVYVSAFGDRHKESRSSFAQRIHAEGVAEHVDRFAAFQRDPEYRVTVHTLVLSGGYFGNIDRASEMVAVKLVCVYFFLTYEQDAAAIFGFDRNIAYDGKKIEECRVFTGTKLFHLFVVQNRVD